MSAKVWAMLAWFFRFISLVGRVLYHQSAVALAEALCKNPSSGSALQHVRVGHNNIGQDGAAAIVGLMAEANVLQTLDVSSTGSAVEPLFAILSKGLCDHLAHLNVSHNRFLAR
jgi:hypothetical protein